MEKAVSGPNTFLKNSLLVILIPATSFQIHKNQLPEIMVSVETRNITLLDIKEQMTKRLLYPDSKLAS